MNNNGGGDDERGGQQLELEVLMPAMFRALKAAAGSAGIGGRSERGLWRAVIGPPPSTALEGLMVLGNNTPTCFVLPDSSMYGRGGCGGSGGHSRADGSA